MLVHPNSQETMRSCFDLFSVPATQMSIESQYDLEVHPTSILSDSSPIEFNVVPSVDWTDLSRSYLYLTVQITNTNPAKADDDRDCAPINNLFHSLFKNIEMSLNNVAVTDSMGNYALKALIPTLLTYNKDAKASFLRLQGFFPDDAGEVNTMTGATINSGYVARKAWINEKKGKIVLMGKPMLEMFCQPRALMPQMPFQIKLFRNSDEFLLQYPAAVPPAVQDHYHLSITSATLIVRRLKAYPEVSLGFEKALATTPAKYFINRNFIKVINLVPNTNIHNINNIILGRIPRNVILGIVKDSDLSGVLTTSPFTFDHNTLKQINVMVDSEHVHGSPLMLDYDNNDTARAYTVMRETVFPFELYQSNSLEPAAFSKTGYCLYPFELGPDSSRSNFNYIKQGNLSIQLIFKTAPSSTLSLILFFEVDNSVEVNFSRQVLPDLQP